jgi:enoyl-CoA hydratase
MTIKQVTIRDIDAVRVVTISNPPRGYMNTETASELCDVLEASEKNANVKALVFTGGLDGVFIRHYDVGEIM